MATIAARLSANGVYFARTYFDEVTTSYTPITTGSLNFNGSSYLGMSDNSNLPNNMTPYTIEAFINIPNGATVGNWGICGWGNWGNNSQVTAFRTNGPSTLITYWWGNDVIISTIPFNDGQWHHVVTQFDGVTRTIFVDGISLGGDVAFDHTVTQYNNFRVGSTNNGEYFNGKISNLRIVSGVAVYSGDFKVPNKPLRAVQGASTNIKSIADGQTVLLLNTATNNPYKDNSSYGYSVTNTSVTSLSDSPFPTLVPENLNKIGLSAIYSYCFDEVTIQGIGGGIAKRETDDGSVLVSGYFDEVTGINDVQSLIGSTISTHSPTLFGSPSLSATSLFTGGENSYNLNGTNQYLSLPASTDWVMGTGDFTIEWFQYMKSQPSNPRVFSIGTYPSAAWAVSIEGGTFYHWEANAFRFSNSLTAGGYLNQWIHFAICRINNTTKVYKNGTQIGSSYVDNNNINNSSTILAIGQESIGNSSGSYFPGLITSFRICKGLGVYTGNFTRPTSKLGRTQSANPYGGSNTSAINAGSCVLLLNP